jgi:hypothetical protein
LTASGTAGTADREVPSPNELRVSPSLVSGGGQPEAEDFNSLLNLSPIVHAFLTRNDTYVVSEALRLMQKTGNPKFSDADAAVIKNYKSHIDAATKFIPGWVKVAVALAPDGRRHKKRRIKWSGVK